MRRPWEIRFIASNSENSRISRPIHRTASRRVPHGQTRLRQNHPADTHSAGSEPGGTLTPGLRRPRRTIHSPSMSRHGANRTPPEPLRGTALLFLIVTAPALVAGTDAALPPWTTRTHPT